MIFSIVFIIIFIIGFAFGLAMPFILFKFPFDLNKREVEVEEKKTISNNAEELLNEWLNGKQGD